MDALEIVRAVFPVMAGPGSLELASEEPSEDPERLTVRLVVWDEVDGNRQIRDIKEQQVYVGGLEEVDTARLAMAVDGWRMAIEQLFAQDSSEWLGVLMPSDLIRDFSELVALKRPRSADDFAEALLSSKQRLGRWLKE